MNYIQHLQEEFDKRKMLNKRYSPRAFARDLGLSAAFLSQVLHSKRSLSVVKAIALIKKLDLPPSKAKKFLNSVLSLNPKNKNIEEFLSLDINNKISSDTKHQDVSPNKPKIVKKRAVNVMTFSEISDWHYSAIIALSQIEKIKVTPALVAKKFSIEVGVARKALDKLLAIGMLKKNRDDSLSGAGELIKIYSSPSSSIRSHHAQFLARAKHALYNHRPQDRDITGTTFLMDEKKMTQAKKLIEEFRENMNILVTKNDSDSKVFRLSIQLFSLE